MKTIVTRLCLTVLAILTIATCHGQATLLWKIDCDSCPKSSFLMGTNHNFDGQYLFQHADLAGIAYTVDAIATEGERSTSRYTMVHDDSLISGVALSALLDSSDYNLVKQKFEKALGAPFSIMEKYYPKVIMDAIHYGESENRNSSRHKSHPRDSVNHDFMDMMIQDIAIDRKIPLYGLETRQEIYKMQCLDMPLKEQAQMLVNTLKVNHDDIMWAMFDTCFVKQDLDCMCSVVPGINSYSDPGDSTLIYKRNLLWMEKIPVLIHKQSILIAVGSLHLCGNEGLINLLLRKKYKLTPLLYK